MHFDRSGNVSSSVLHYINELSTNGYSVVFVTNSGRLTPSAAVRLKDICVTIFVRRNIGYDFGAWRDVIQALSLPTQETEELIIINDSIYGPLKELAGTLTRLNYGEADVWGLTESWQHCYHLQSFFIAFGKNALQSPAFTTFWRDIRLLPFKSFIVRKYETGLTQTMLKAGLRCRAVWNYEDLIAQVTGKIVLNDITQAERNRSMRLDPIMQMRKLQAQRIRGAASRQIAMNPTADLWRQLLISGFPFIKRELLLKNPSEVKDIGDWPTVVRKDLDGDPELVLNDLRFELRNRAP